MDLAGADAGMRPYRTRLRGTLARLAGAALCAFTTLGCVLALGGMLAERSMPNATFAPFGGWQLEAMAAGFGFVLLALLVATIRALRRRYRGLGEQTPYRKCVLLAVFLPGVFVGALLGNPMSAAISWASNLTASAHRAHSAASRLLAEDGKGPAAPATGKPAAAPAVSARLLRAADLGAGWYTAQRPSASEAAVTPTQGMYGATLAARATFQQARWTGAAWLPKHVSAETLLRFRSAADLRRYVEAEPDGSFTTSLIGGMTVRERGLGASAPSRSAEFAVGADLFSVTIDVNTAGSPTPEGFAALVEKAVRQAG